MDYFDAIDNTPWKHRHTCKCNECVEYFAFNPTQQQQQQQEEGLAMTD